MTTLRERRLNPVDNMLGRGFTNAGALLKGRSPVTESSLDISRATSLFAKPADPSAKTASGIAADEIAARKGDKIKGAFASSFGDVAIAGIESSAARAEAQRDIDSKVRMNRAEISFKEQQNALAIAHRQSVELDRMRFASDRAFENEEFMTNLNEAKAYRTYVRSAIQEIKNIRARAGTAFSGGQNQMFLKGEVG